MPGGRRPEDVALAFDRAARGAGIAYCFVGAIAVGAWGQPRATSDVDVIVDLPPERDRAFADALLRERLGVNPRSFAEARADRSHVTIFDEGGAYNVACKHAVTSVEQREVAEAADLKTSLGTLRVARPEETIAFKVKFGSEQDLKDARSIIVRQAETLDVDRLMEHADRLHVADEVASLLRRYGPR